MALHHPLLLYAPTFRDDFEKTHIVDYSCFDVDFEKVHQTVTKKFGGEWVILVKFHPIMQRFIDEKRYFQLEYVKNVTSFSKMQAMLAAADVVLTDYSSLIFDAVIAGIPSFTLCLDYEQYKVQQDLYFDMKELPFPFASSNTELIYNMERFDSTEYEKACHAFAARWGIIESGHASKDISEKIMSYLKEGTVKWD